MKLTSRWICFCTALTVLPFVVLGADPVIVSRPVGFVRISIVTNEQCLVSLPFKPFASSVNDVLNRQLTGTADEQTADQVLKWDAAITRYVRALKADGTGNAEIDGKWFSDFQKLIPSDMTLQPGEGFFLWNRQSSTQDVFLAGEVVLDAANSMVLIPSLNLIGYPYSTPSCVSGLPCETKGEQGQSTGSLFEMGRGYWYNNTSSVATVWVETRPYADVFPPAGEIPSIVGIQIIDGSEAKLTIETEGASGEKLDVYYKDLNPADQLETDKGWLMADVDVPVNGKTTVEWTDAGNSQRRPVNEIFARYYLVGRADILGTDGVPLCRSRFVFGKSLSIEAGTVASALRADSSSVSTNLSSVSSNLVAGSPILPLAVSVSLCRIIYVDRNSGADHLTGRSAVVVGSDGPKKTIGAGLLEVGNEGNTLIIKSGTYSEDLNIAGKNVKVIIQGNVDLRGNSQQVPEIPAIVPPVETNFMNSVTNR